METSINHGRKLGGLLKEFIVDNLEQSGYKMLALSKKVKQISDLGTAEN